ncbi:hypothetical protein QJQ45_015283 [Haematococcus lacustris]|nr:hypothetical protein QJQ45_015283 [Haematococcus lacustris]
MARWSPNRGRGNSPNSRGGGAGGRPAASSSPVEAPEQANTLFMVRYHPMFPKLSRTEPVATPIPFEQHPEQMSDEEHLDYYSRQPRWVIDSGASSHVMPWRSCLSDYVSFNPPIQLQLGGTGSSINVLGRGTTYLTNAEGEQWAVSGVLHAPDAAYCYLSVSQLTHAGVHVSFQGDYCELIGPGNPPEWRMRVRKAAPGLYWWYINAVAQGNCVVGPGADHEYESDGVDPEAHGSHCQELDPQLLQTKDQVPAAIQQVITELETQSGQRCKALRSDNGSEYCNKTVQDWCSSKGIQQQFSAPYCPEQNGKAERLNRTIMQSTRSMLLTSGLPSGHSLTPWEAFYHRKPNLSALRVFGATAWVFVTAPNRNKLQAKAVKGVFLGYAVGSKAYRIWVGGKLVVSKDVQIVKIARADDDTSSGSYTDLP